MGILDHGVAFRPVREPHPFPGLVSGRRRSLSRRLHVRLEGPRHAAGRRLIGLATSVQRILVLSMSWSDVAENLMGRLVIRAQARLALREE